jgi:hypothetical protein
MYSALIPTICGWTLNPSSPYYKIYTLPEAVIKLRHIFDGRNLLNRIHFLNLLVITRSYQIHEIL